MTKIESLSLDVLSQIMGFLLPISRVTTIETINVIDKFRETCPPVLLWRGLLFHIQGVVKEIDLVSSSRYIEDSGNQIPDMVRQHLHEKECKVVGHLCDLLGKKLRSLKLPGYICPRDTSNILYRARNCTALERVALHQDLSHIEEDVGDFLNGLPSLRTLEISVMDIHTLNSLIHGGCRVENLVIHTLTVEAASNFADFLSSKGRYLQRLVIKEIRDEVTFRNIEEDTIFDNSVKLQRELAKVLAFDANSMLQNLSYVEIPMTSQTERSLEKPEEFLVYAFKGQAEVCIRKDTIDAVLLYDKESNVQVREVSIDPFILNMALRNPDILVHTNTLNLPDSSVAESYFHCSNTMQAIDFVLDNSCYALEHIDCRFTPSPENDARTAMAFLGVVLNKCKKNVNLTCSYTLLMKMFGVHHEGEDAELFEFTLAAMGKIKTLRLFRSIECPIIDGCEPCARVDIAFLSTLSTFFGYVPGSMSELTQISFSMSPFSVAEHFEYVYLALRRAIKDVGAFSRDNPEVDVSSMRYELDIWLRRHNERMFNGLG
ncbi:hypothetical protein BWQ96_08488 [Gracilariopsis chorda]|uniref:Uncharacterized protein n=1 Tax=Gracilariopsis chorda TaxID=448386 RepID=A0A2V3II77_9FLOR|nr:hypothetical protein BWQ96_08488 [Gracilariopsis chorda]|eukprot:PXF41794.1 hypothetical protein BWQ96_08488 [Gracilariopsis chorda]